MKKACNTNKSNNITLNNYYVYNCLYEEYHTYKKQKQKEGKSAKEAIELANKKFFFGKEPVTFEQFVQIQEEFGKLITDAILKGYKFIFPYLVCLVGLIKEKNNHKKTRINWGKSTNLKNKLIEEGKIPASQIKSEDNEKFGKKDNYDNPLLTNNNLWQVFYTNDWFPKLVYMPMKVINHKFYKSMHLLFWRGTFVRSFTTELYKRINNKEIIVEFIKN